MDRTNRNVPPVARLAFAAQGAYILVISTIPFARLIRDPDAPIGPGSLILQFVLWSILPAVALLVAAWGLGRPMEPINERLLRGGAIVSTAYLALGCVIVLARPSTTAITIGVRLAVLIAGAIGLIGLPRPTSEGEPAFALAPSVQPSSRSTTTIR